MQGGRKTRRKLKALEKGWNSRAFIADSRNNPRVHETHRAYFDKIPGQRYVSINYDLYGAMANTHRRAQSLGVTKVGGSPTSKRGRNRTLGDTDYAFMDDPAEFTVVVHVVSSTGERLPGSTVAVYVKHSGEAVGTGTADRTGRAVVVCHYDAWTAVPFYLEALAPGYVAAGLDFEVTAKECAAQLALESEEEVAHREAMTKLSEEEARRLSRQRFTVRALVSHLSSSKPVPGATVIVRTAHHGSMCGQGVTDAGGVAEVACAHPHWDTTPLRAEVAIRGFVPTSADLRAVVGSAFMDTNLRVETEEEVAARGEADAAKFSVWAVIRDRVDDTPVPGADVEVEHAASRTVLARGRTQPDGSALLMVESDNWATDSFAVHVRHPDYPAYREAVQIRTREHRFEAHMTSKRELERQRAESAAAAAQRQAEANAREEEERAAAARALKDVEDHTRVDDQEFVLTVYAVSLFKGTCLPGARVSVVVKATGQQVGEAVADDEGLANVMCQYPQWRDTEFLLQAEASGYETTAKAVRPNKSPQMLRVALEDEAAADDTDEHEFKLTVHVTDGEGKRDLEGAKVTLRIKATGDDLAEGMTDAEGICVLHAMLAGWREQGMYLHVSADGHSSAASDINVTSKEHTTEVALDSNQVATAKRLHRSETSASMRAQRARFSLRLKCVDAATKAPIPGAVLRVSVQATGRVIGTGIADEGGVATIDATYKRWNKTPMKVEAVKDGWVTVAQQLQMKTAEYEAQVILCEPVPDGRIKAVLTWVEEPQDLDLHVLCPNGADISFRHPKDEGMGVEVEMDDRSGYGPETIAMKLGNADDWFRVVARNFSKDVSITVSHAQVALVVGDRVAHMFHVPGSQSTNEWWDVCGVHGRSGRVVETNYLLEEQPDRERGLRGVDPDGKDVAGDAMDDDDDW